MGPKAGTGSHEIIALNQPFAKCGKLRPEVYGAQAGLQGAHKCHSINLSRLHDVLVT
jgi:hypothetical protein